MKLAVLIDLDNLKSEMSLSRMYLELKSIGDVILNYGFYCNYNDKNMKSLLQQFGMESIMQPGFKAKENCTDIRITIEAMDLLNTRTDIDAIVIASNDSDFICLSRRLQHSHKKTIVVTDIPLDDPNYLNYFDMHIDIHDLLSTHITQKVELFESENKVLSESKGEQDEIGEDKLPSDNKKISVTDVDNSTNIIDEISEPKIKELILKIASIMTKVDIKNDMARLNDICNMLRTTEKVKFDPSQYGASHKRPLKFFREDLKEYIDVKSEENCWWMKIKTRGE